MDTPCLKHDKLFRPNQISSKAKWRELDILKQHDAVYEGWSLLMHVFVEAAVWVSDFRPDRLCDLWSPEEEEYKNVITQHQAFPCTLYYQPVRSQKVYTAGLF